MNKIYLDNNATTAVDPRVLNAMIDDLTYHDGNPSSVHSFGKDSRQRITKVRDRIAHFLGVKSHEIVFTSGGTEALNMMIQSQCALHTNGHIISSAVEHSCVYATLKLMEARGFQVTFLPPGPYGAVTPEAVREAIRADTRFITLMAVNNETGVKTDISSIAALAQEHQIPFLVDGVALLGKELFTIPHGVSGMGFSGHKFHAPKGVGFAYLGRQISWKPFLMGGDQEYGLRGGTENVSGIIGMGEAVRLLSEVLPEATSRMMFLRDKLEKSLLELGDVEINGLGPRICNTTNLSFSGVDGEALLALLDMEGVAVSHGSACASGAMEPSRILLNMDLPMAVAQSSMRISLSRLTIDSDVDRAVEIIKKTVSKLRYGR